MGGAFWAVGRSRAQSVLIITGTDTIELSMSEVTGIVPMDGGAQTAIRDVVRLPGKT